MDKFYHLVYGIVQCDIFQIMYQCCLKQYIKAIYKILSYGAPLLYKQSVFHLFSFSIPCNASSHIFCIPLSDEELPSLKIAMASGVDNLLRASMVYTLCSSIFDFPKSQERFINVSFRKGKTSFVPRIPRASKKSFFSITSLESKPSPDMISNRWGTAFL